MGIKKYQFSKDESILRKYWLFATFFSYVLYPLLAITLLFFFKETLPKDAFSQTSAQLIGGLFAFWIIWYCAYENPGTAWLTCLLVIKAYALFSSISSIIRDSNIWNVGLESIEIAIVAWWCLLSLKLRKLNIKIQIETFVSSAFYHVSVNSIRSAVDLDDLQFKYHDAIRKYPEHFSQVLLPQYVEMKKWLSQTDRLT